MYKENVSKILVAAVLVYTGVYLYQRYKRKKANETVVSYEDAIKILDGIE